MQEVHCKTHIYVNCKRSKPVQRFLEIAWMELVLPNSAPPDFTTFADKEITTL